MSWGRRGQTIELREKISYKTMMFLQVVDVGDWSCRITPANELVCVEHELARCGPGNGCKARGSAAADGLPLDAWAQQTPAGTLLRNRESLCKSRPRAGRKALTRRLRSFESSADRPTLHQKLKCWKKLLM
jgi:hypothetical protein